MHNHFAKEMVHKFRTNADCDCTLFILSQAHLTVPVDPGVLAFCRPMSSDAATSSQRWSCATLEQGMVHVMKDVNGKPAVDFDQEEAALLIQLKDIFCIAFELNNCVSHAIHKY